MTKIWFQEPETERQSEIESKLILATFFNDAVSGVDREDMLHGQLCRLTSTQLVKQTLDQLNF